MTRDRRQTETGKRCDIAEAIVSTSTVGKLKNSPEIFLGSFCLYIFRDTSKMSNGMEGDINRETLNGAFSADFKFG